MSGNARIADRFAQLAAERRAGLVTFVMGGDPDPERSLALIEALPGAGADLIEIGMPFSDPMADGPAIQAGGKRALAAGMTLRKTLDLVARFRAKDGDTPIILMGYYNPIYSLGPEAFARAAAKAGVDGLIIVDLPPEEDAELGPYARDAGLAMIRLVTPTTDDARLPAILAGAGGFLYYVTVTGTTGARAAVAADVAPAVRRLKQRSVLPVAAGFGIRTPEQAAAIGAAADAVAVGTALVGAVGDALASGGDPVAAALDLVRALAGGLRRRVEAPA